MVLRCFSFEQLTNGNTYYITYDYKMKIAEDVVELAKEKGVDFVTAIDRYRDVITGRYDGSYFCNSFKAQLALLGNKNIIIEAENEGYLENVMLYDFGEIDIKVREYLLDCYRTEILYFAKQIEAE